MAIGAITSKVNSQLEGGPKMFSFTVTAASGDVAASFDLSAYFGKSINALLGLRIFTAAAEVAVATVDFTTVATTLSITFTNPAADATIYVTVAGV